ncbi:bifunctional folylpolyglutamate synthase/dihydrofolate synthase [Desulforhopalus vacuolatus]|uniref:bifunctional folylpolyglutamate synthase/dihydrofolate synthase n=1 Tax=Desulforhopalus vacuolatus TaxID=40414 RepID=UPI001963CFA0|nr:folylpolyglutamate synthase/dihydrofolate synthase family protein [Desulforhopalus vacuolatus]MBM9518553.1 bifunctional folylpolyglutamate synthase/dihydrofolate synthase [Desulforhopalus vacuolatus]
MNYSDVCAYLDVLQMHKIKLGLEAMQAFLRQVGNPEAKLQIVHLAGTNGKGTVCAALHEILSRAHYKVGVYTSPHLSSPRERFRVGRDFISEEDFARLGSHIIAVLDGEQITWFEFTTALAFLWFEEQGTDIVMMETGMGGRLDATNVVRPLVSVITSISMDHEAWLGNTLATIAGEKAGIIKERVPVISGAAGEAAVVIASAAQEKDAPFYQLHHDFDFACADNGSWSWQGKGLPGERQYSVLHSQSPSLVQQENESLAVAVVQVLELYGFRVADSDIISGLAALKWPGRMEFFTVVRNGRTLSFLLDGAHNPAGVANLAATLTAHFPGRRLALWGSMADKDLGTMLHCIAPLFDEMVFTRPHGERSAEPEAIVEFLLPEDKPRAYCERHPAEALERVCASAGKDDLIVVAGSLYLIGAIRPMLVGEIV